MSDSRVIFEIHPQSVIMKNASAHVEEEIDDFLSYTNPNARHIRQYKLQQAEASKSEQDRDYWTKWDGKIHLYKYQTFDIGFLWRVTQMLQVMKVKYTYEDMRQVPHPVDRSKVPKFEGELHPYQHEILIDMIQHPHGIVDVATGGGKTVMALSLIAKRPVRTFVIVPTVALVDEWILKAKQFLKFPNGHNYFGYASGRRVDLGLFNVANIQTLYNALFKRATQTNTVQRYYKIIEAYKAADMIIVDECHHASTATYRKSIMASNAYYRYGITATTDKRHDSADMEYYGLLGERLSRISASDLIEDGFISPARVIFQRWGYMPFYGSVKFQGVGGVEDQALVYNHQRNTQICNDIVEAISHKRRVMVMVRRLDHGKLLLQILESKLKEHIRIEWIYGDHPEKAQIIRDFRDKKIHILITQNQLLSEGVDIPDVSAVVMAAGGKSAIKTIQSIGRGIRKAEGKTDLVVYDYADEGRYIQEHALQRLNTYAAESAFQIEAEGTNLENYIQHLRDIGHGI